MGHTVLNILCNRSYKRFTYLDEFHLLIFIQILFDINIIKYISSHKSSLSFQISIKYIYIIYHLSILHQLYIYNISYFNNQYPLHVISIPFTCHLTSLTISYYFDWVTLSPIGVIGVFILLNISISLAKFINSAIICWHMMSCSVS